MKHLISILMALLCVTYSYGQNYDVNLDGKISIDDVSYLIKRLLNSQNETCDTISMPIVEIYKNGVLDSIYMNDTDTYSVVFKYNEDDKNILKGEFSVSASKKVHFAKGNLYWDGHKYHLENNQISYPTEWDANHVGHFFWVNNNDALQSSKEPYAEIYSYNTQTVTDVFFCGEDNKISVDGSSGLYALNADEWAYLYGKRTNYLQLRKMNVTVGDMVNCLVFAPDDFQGTLTSSYTLEEANQLGLLCLPPAGDREYNEQKGVNGLSGKYKNYAQYWSSTPASNNSTYAYSLRFNTNGVFSKYSSSRSEGFNIRLAKTVE